MVSMRSGRLNAAPLYGCRNLCEPDAARRLNHSIAPWSRRPTPRPLKPTSIPIPSPTSNPTHRPSVREPPRGSPHSNGFHGRSPAPLQPGLYPTVIPRRPAFDRPDPTSYIEPTAPRTNRTAMRRNTTQNSARMARTGRRYIHRLPSMLPMIAVGIRVSASRNERIECGWAVT